MDKKVRYRGRFSQIGIYLGKFLRMFVYQSDWTVLPMAALISGLVAYVVGANINKTQEGTLTGCFAMVCVCVWNGFFNSIQSVCRERSIVKREHRSGMHISSYIAAHMIYQTLLCVAQTVILLFVCQQTGVFFPTAGLVTKYYLIDMGISMFLVTFAADMLSLVISSVVHNTTTAMTMMPFMLIFQLVFSGGMFSLDGFARKFSNVTITKWGLNSFCALGNYNNLPMVTLWNSIWKFRSMEIDGQKPIKMMTNYIIKNNQLDELLLESGRYNMNPAYTATAENVLHCWGVLIVMIFVFALLAMIILEFIDNDKR